MGDHSRASEEREITAEALDKALALSEGLLRIVLNELPLSLRTPSAEEMSAFAAAFPRWKITTGVAYGQATKSYSRQLDDLRPGFVRGGDLRFDDSEHFDTALLAIFSDCRGSGDLGTFPHFTITAREATPVDYSDFARIYNAEQYLRESDFLRQLPADTATAASKG